MSWKKFLDDTVGTDLKKDVASKTGVDASTISRWFSSGEPGKAENVIKLARAYGREPMAALVAAEFLTPDEAKVRPAAAPDYSQLTNDELLELVRTRMREEGGGEHAGGSAPTKTPGSGPDIGMLVKRYLNQAGGDLLIAGQRLAADGAAGANVDRESWEAALEWFSEVAPVEQPLELPDQVAARRSKKRPPRGTRVQEPD